MSRFDKIWKKLAKKGECNSFEGMEWDRVEQEWRDWGEKQAIKQFIANRANINREHYMKLFCINLQPKQLFDFGETKLEKEAKQINQKDAQKGSYLLND